MSIVRMLAFLLAVLACTGAAVGDEVRASIRVGVTAFRDKSVTVTEWQPTMDFLANQIPGVQFEVVPLNLMDFEKELQGKHLDFVITNPQHYITLEQKYQASRVATLMRAEHGQIVNQFGGVVFTRADRSDINEIQQLRGKRIAATDPTSFAAYLIQFDLLKDHGLEPKQDYEVTFLGFPQDLNVKAVMDGRQDAGFVRSGVLEYMVRDGKLRMEDIKVLHRQHAGDFPFVVSSDLYPEWPMAVLPHVSIDLRNRVVAAILLIQPGAPATEAGKYYRWSTPVEYLSVQRFMQRMHIYPYDKVAEVSVAEFMRLHALEFAALALVVAAVVTLQNVRVQSLNRSLEASRQELRSMAQHDVLTGLPNRYLLNDRLDQSILRAERSKGLVAVCMLDLDGFKPINDKLGHAVGDQVLITVARRISGAVRAADTVARFGGDEFVLLIHEIEPIVALPQLLHRVIAAVADQMEHCGDLRVHASVGVSILSVDATDTAMLLKHADEAMYRAKAAGGNQFVLYAGIKTDTVV